eukprot:GHVH01010006.1.p1 GENE.GHVH01010006.1~~GHVH01010006.1.p1  ORF type:complete len:388 (+),score=60.99 GHVH01010006.1:118-1281(+)
MGVRNVQKVKKAKTTEKNTERKTPKNEEATLVADSIEKKRKATKGTKASKRQRVVVELSDPPSEEVEMDVEMRDSMPRYSEESVITINSINISPARSDAVVGDEDLEDVPQPHASESAVEPQEGLISRFFGSMFRKRCQAVPPLVIVEDPAELIVEVIHIFRCPEDAKAHESLANRQKKRVSRSSIRGCANIDVDHQFQGEALKDMPDDERVVLLRRVLSPRRNKNLSQEAVMEKASSCPHLWLFLPYSTCKRLYTAELCDFLSNRCSWPSSQSNSPDRTQQQDETCCAGMTPGYGGEQPEKEACRQTPMLQGDPKDLPPNSVDAPVRWQGLGEGCLLYNKDQLPAYTPLIDLSPPPKATAKQRDEQSDDDVQVAADDIENCNPIDV